MHALPIIPSLSATAPATAEAEGEPSNKRHRPNDDDYNDDASARTAVPASSRRPVIAWIGQTATVRGKFDVNKAKALGIPAGK